MNFSLFSFFQFLLGFVIISAVACFISTCSNKLSFWGIFFSILLFHLSLYWLDEVSWLCLRRWFTHSCLLLIFKQFVMLPLSPLFLVMFRTLFLQITNPVQNMALSFGWGLFGVMCPIVLAWLIAAYSIPGFCCLVFKSPGSTIRCLNWSFGSNPALKPWNLWIAVAQAVTRGQYVTVQHDCLRLHVLGIMAMGMCWIMIMIKLSELMCFLWLSFVEFWSFCMVIVLENFHFSKKFP